MTFFTNPEEIEKRSFEIISEKLADRKFEPQNLNVIKRVIHTTADFDYADNLYFSENVVTIAQNALNNKARIVTDTQMAKAGINKKALEKLCCSVYCFIDAPEVVKTSCEKSITRAQAAVDIAVETLSCAAPTGCGTNTTPVIFVIGNAPTALIRLHELINQGKFAPAMIIAVPVGFVNVIESKELIMGLNVPHIAAKGQKGGSNVAAAICNALLYETTGRML